MAEGHGVGRPVNYTSTTRQRCVSRVQNLAVSSNAIHPGFVGYQAKETRQAYARIILPHRPFVECELMHNLRLAHPSRTVSGSWTTKLASKLS